MTTMTTKTKKAYVCLDSRYGKYSDDHKHITWNFENSLVESDNSTNVVGDIKNFIAIRLYSLMTPKYTSTLQRTAVLIEEFAAQSFMLPNTRRFHFITLLNDIQDAPIDLGARNAVTDGSSLRIGDFTLSNKAELLSGYKFNDGIYRFNHPINHVDTLTISISDPIDLVAIPKYQFTNVVWDVIQTDTLRLILTFPEPHGYTALFTTPDFTLFVDGFSAPSDAFLTTLVNSKEHTVYEVNDAYTITIKLGIDAKAGTLIASIPPNYLLSSFTLPVVKQPVTVRFNSHRLIINLELDYLLDDKIDDTVDVIPRSVPSKLKYRYLMLDSYNTYDAESTTSKFTWLLNDKVPTLSKGYINVPAPIHNIVKARLGRITFNNMLTTFIAEVNSRHRYGFGFTEFASQALITPAGNKFQFIEFLPEYDSSGTYNTTLSPFNCNRGWFRFREKFNLLDKLTLTITNLITDVNVSTPDSVVQVLSGIQRFNTFSYTDSEGATYDNPLEIIGLIPPGPVTLSGFTTDDPVADAALIAAYNTTHTLHQLDSSSYYECPINIASAHFTAGWAEVPITATCTLQPNPRFLGVLELLCDVDNVQETESLTIAKLNPMRTTLKYAYVLLDTNNIDPNLSSDIKFGWNFVPNTVLSTGTVNSTTPIKDLVGMRVFPMTSNFIAPITEPGKTLVNDVSNMGYNFTILIHEFAAQSFVGRNGFKYHFVLYPQLMNPVNPPFSTSYTPANPYFEYTTSGKGNGWFWFRKPITTFSTLTVSMGNPFDYVKSSNVTRVLIPIQLIFLG